jgi:uncharacterized protein
MHPYRILIVTCLLSAVTTVTSEPLKVLLLSGLNNHNWRETTPCLKKILEESGRFAVETTEHPEQLAPGDLSKYDVIVSDWNSWKNKKIEEQWSPDLRKAYLDFVRNGKGHVVVHAGSCSFYKGWPEYQQLCGFAWKLGQTGHGPRHGFKVKPTEVDHPVTRGLEPFETTDELWNRPGVQPGVTVLAESFSAKEKRGTGAWEPSALVNAFGGGRNFALVLGHDAKAMSTPGFRALLTRGTEWAATGKVTLITPDIAGSAAGS